jgi:hypothetical protein
MDGPMTGVAKHLKGSPTRYGVERAGSSAINIVASSPPRACRMAAARAVIFFIFHPIYSKKQFILPLYTWHKDP